MSLPPDLEDDGLVCLLLQCFRFLRVCRTTKMEVRRGNSLASVVHESELIYDHLGFGSWRLTHDLINAGRERMRHLRIFAIVGYMCERSALLQRGKIPTATKIKIKIALQAGSLDRPSYYVSRSTLLRAGVRSRGLGWESSARVARRYAGCEPIARWTLRSWKCRSRHTAGFDADLSLASSHLQGTLLGFRLRRCFQYLQKRQV